MRENEILIRAKGKVIFSMKIFGSRGRIRPGLTVQAQKMADLQFQQLDLKLLLEISVLTQNRVRFPRTEGGGIDRGK